MASQVIKYYAEALLCAGPHTLAAAVLWGLPFVAGNTGFTLFLALALASSCTLVFTAYWSLVFAVIGDRHYRFGAHFWTGVTCAVLAVASFVYLTERVLIWLVVSAPVVISAIHFARLQMAWRKGSSP